MKNVRTLKNEVMGKQDFEDVPADKWKFLEKSNYYGLWLPGHKTQKEEEKHGELGGRP